MKQLRAYLAVKNIKTGDCKISNHGFSIWINIVNTGQTPASKVKITRTCTFTCTKSESLNWGAISNKVERHGRMDFPFSNKDTVKIEKSLRNGTLKVSVIGQVEYEDIYERQRNDIVRQLRAPSPRT